MLNDSWVVKYRPKTSNDLIGNRSNYIKLIAWLKTFYAQDKTDTKKFKPIILLVGPPGIGKTSGITAVANELKLEIVEFNASDQRNAGAITRLVGRASKTKTNPGFTGRIVLLDEVDGIHGNEDRGGLAALLKLAKESFHPIICTANDPNSAKMRSFKKSVSVLALTFNKPSNNEVVGLLQKIVLSEKIEAPIKLLNVIANNAKGDIRGSVNDLENLAQGRKVLPMNSIQALSIRDTEVSIGIALNQIFGESKTLRQAHEVTSDLDVDYSMFEMYVNDNISAHAKNSSELRNMYSNSSLSNLFYSRIQMQKWKFLKYCYFFLSSGIRSEKKTPYSEQYPRFPSSLMALSQTKKIRAIRTSVSLKIGKLTHSSIRKTIDDTIPFLRSNFESLFNEFLINKLESEKGLTILQTIADIHNKVDFEEDEMFFLFNNPLYEKPTAAVEKKQKLLIKLIEQKAEEIRQRHVLEYNIQINKGRKFNFLDEVEIKQPEIKKQELIALKEQKKKPQKKVKTNSGPKITKTVLEEKDIKKPQKKVKKPKTGSLLDLTKTKSSKEKNIKKKSKPIKNLKDFI